LPTTFPHGSHIARKRGIYCYRRRLPGLRRSEVCVSLRTRCYREAEHCAAILDKTFDSALRRARENMNDATDLNLLLRAYLQESLARDLERRMQRPPGTPVYGHWWEPGDPGTAAEADLVHRFLGPGRI
jgi:hypothetical protein